MGIQDNDKDAHKRDTVLATYGSEAIILAEVGLTSYRVHNHDESKNNEAM